MADILLIHGTWTGGWMWKPLKDRLIARGHNVATPTLTGLGEREHLLTPAVGLDTHIRDLEAVVKWEMLDNIVAVAHSYGGMLISALADSLPGKFAGAAFLNAALPKDGEAMLDYQTPDRVREVMALVEEEGDGYRVPRRLLLKTGLTDPEAFAARRDGRGRMGELQWRREQVALTDARNQRFAGKPDLIFRLGKIAAFPGA